MNKLKDSYLNRRYFASYFTAVISIALTLFLLGVIGVLIINGNRVANYVRENIGFTILIKDKAKEADVKLFQKELDIAPYVKSTNFISKEKAADDLKIELGEDFVSFLEFNPLANSIDIQLHSEYANLDSLEVIENKLNKSPVVKEIFYQKTLVSLVNNNIQQISGILLSLALVMFLIAVVLINNTVRLAIYSKRFLIRTMTLVGASNSFIRRPFVFRSAIQGAIGALLGIVLLLLSVYMVQQNTNNIVELQNISVVLISLTLVGLLITIISSVFATNKFLNSEIDKLYF